MKRKSLSVLLAMVFIFTMLNSGMLVSTYGRTAEKYKTLANASITQQEELKIPMDQALMKASVNSKNVYVLDKNGKRALIAISIDNTGKTIIIKPKGEYTVGGSYTLYISKEILYKNGRHPLVGFKQSFVVRAKVVLPVVGSVDNLKKLLSKANQYGVVTGMTGRLEVVFSEDKVTTTAALPAAKENSKAADGASQKQGSDYSTTNVQVEGVDEADIVKTDGKYIYSINNGKLNVTKAVPGDQMERMATVKLVDAEGSFQPYEIYFDSDSERLVVLGWSNSRLYYKRLNPEVMPYGGINSTKAIIYDTKDKRNLTKIREVELEGSYVSSRKIGSKLYMITNKSMYNYMGADEQNITPSYRDTAKGNAFNSIKCDSIRYFPESIQPNFMLIGVVDISKNDKPASITTYLGSGNSIYMTESNLYVAVSKYEFKPMPKETSMPSTGMKVMPGIWWPGPQSTNTLVYKFKVKENTIDFAASGEVPGVILNQFSMDENKDTFRIATTTGDMWATDENMSKNNLYILNEQMKVCGSLVDMAPGEKIYSVRFMGEKAYIVTYKKVDPLFVIDLKDKTSPKILGTLKIPGYSDYLHPYDETHIIGFGKDSVEVPYKDQTGKVIGTNAYYLGMKVALFDVSEVTKPREISHIIIGDRGTHSPLLNDHKALMFSKGKNLMAFPVTEYKLTAGQSIMNEQNGYSYPEYGMFHYQGAFVYNIDVNKGFTLKGKITHISDEEYIKAGSSGYNYLKEINRILYIGDTLYTNSNDMLKANSIKDLKEIGKVDLN